MPLTSRQGVDRRITRSRQALRTALIDLMEEKGYDSISVNDLCVYADLNRGTFYNHFHDKEDLLTTFENEVIDDLDDIKDQLKDLSVLEFVRARLKQEPYPLLVELFDRLRNQGDFLHAVMGPGGDARFSVRLRDYVCRDFIYSLLHKRYQEHPTPFVEYYISFYANAYLGVITHWIDTDMKESSEEMALIAMRLFFIKPGESITL